VQVAGANVLVTGASSGIGASLAVMLAERGATVGLVGRRAAELDGVLARCQEHAPHSRRWIQDLGDLDAAERLAAEAWDAFGHLDVLVNNAAIPKRRHITDLTVDELDETMRVDFESPVRMTMALLPRWLERGTGSIVNVSSLGGRLGILHETAYCAAKFALCGWTEAMALDLWDTDIEVRLIIPGPIDTDIWDRPDNERAIYDGPKEPPSVVVEGIVTAIEGDTFEHYLPDLKSVAEFKTTDIDAFLGGSAGQLS
jgi:NAD(P)-dependent dehydrogenase (short-subunit alcohol dehydrogenase family)